MHTEPIEQKARRDDDGGSNARRDEPSPKKSKSSSGSSKCTKKGKSARPTPAPVPDLVNGRKTTEVIKAIAAAASRAHANNGDRPADAETPAADMAQVTSEPVGDDTNGAAFGIDRVDVEDEASLITEDLAATDLADAADDDDAAEADDPGAAAPAATTGRPKRGRVTRPAGAPA